MIRRWRFALVSSAVVVLAVAGAQAPAKFEPYALGDDVRIMDPALSRDGSVLYLTRVADKSKYAIVALRRNGSAWSDPMTLPFSGQWRDLEEVLSPDGSTMIFASNRPANSGGQALDSNYYHRFGQARGGNLWLVHATSSGWSTPERLPDAVNANTSTFSPALAADGTLYFMRASGPRLAFHLFQAKLENGEYRSSTLAPFSDERYDDFDPAIAPDGSFVVFTSTRPPAPEKKSALFISYYRNGQWTGPAIIGPPIDPANDAVEARLSPDLKTLYYSSQGSVWESPFSP